MKILLSESIPTEMYLVRHLNGTLHEVENSGEAEFKIVYDAANPSFIWTMSVYHEAFTDFVPMSLAILKAEQSDFYRRVMLLIQRREPRFQFVPVSFNNDDPFPAA